MSVTNTYHPTSLQFSEHNRYSELNLFSNKKRMGRFSYFFYSLVLPFLIFWTMAALAGVVGKMGSLGEMIAYVLLAAALIGAVITFTLLTIQRCHDFNVSGWLSILMLIPFASLLFWLIPGYRGLNKYGEAPKPPSLLLKIGAVSLIVFLVALLTYTGLDLFKIRF